MSRLRRFAAFLRSLWSHSFSTKVTAAGLEQVAYLRPFEVPAVVQYLSQKGISSSVVEGINHTTLETMSAILVHASASEQALQAIRELKGN